jgi:hypothetical protein
MREKKEPTVYVVQSSSRLNLSRATRFGRLEALLPEVQNIVVSTAPCLRELRRKLKDFSDEDHLLLIGDPIAIALAVYVAAEVNNGRVNVLKFDRYIGRHGDYFKLSIDMLDRPSKPVDGLA